MIIIDYSHLSRRMLHTAVTQTTPKPRKVEGKLVTAEYIKMYYHLMLNNLKNSTLKFKGYGDIVLAFDSKNNWRKDYFPDYKKSRAKKTKDGDINFEEFYELTEEFEEILQRDFPYKVVKVDKTEGDDIIGVLAKKYAPTEKTIVITSDKDMKQVLGYGSELYDPIKKEYITMTLNELKAWKIEHILLGDKIDDIPHIKRGTEFTENFISYLKTNSITIDEPNRLNKLEIANELYGGYDVYKINKNGIVQDELDIFKSTPFGAKTVIKFAEDLKNNLKLNPIYVKNFKRNSVLVLFENIPTDLIQDIETAYLETPFEYDPNAIMRFLMKNSLNQLLTNITDFYVEGNRVEAKHIKENESMSEWV